MTKPGLTGPEGQWYEGTWITPKEAEITMAYQQAFDALEDGTVDHLTPDPFYVRGGDLPPLSDADVDRFIAALDEEYDVEISHHLDHHLDRSGATERTELHRLPPLARRWLAELVDAICVKHRDIDQSPAPRPAVPAYTGGG